MLLMAGYGVADCAAQTPPVRIMPLGDSLTLGSGSGTLVEGGYRNNLYSLLTTAGFNVDFVGTQTDANNPGLPDRDHQGMGGYRIEQIQSGLTGWLNVIEDPDVILLMIGTNDFTQNFNLASVQTRLTNLVADLATKRPFAKIILSNLPLRTDNPSLEALQVTFNASIPGIVSNQVSLGRQVSFVDMHSALVASDLNDGVHPKLAGYDKMANVWVSAITSVITPLGTSNPPAIVRIEPLVDKQHVTVKFSKPVADSATNLANFSLTGGLTISQAVLDAATKRYITLTTSTQTPETLYTLTVSGVRDRTAQQNLIAAGSTVTFTPGVLVNGSFEADFTGWTTTGNQFIATGAPYLATDGTKLAAFNGGNLPPNAVLAQAFATTVGQTYTLAFDAGVLAYNTNSQTIQVTVTGAGSLLSQTITLIGAGGGTNRWLPQSFTFVANSTAATLTFRDQSTSTNGLDLLLDNVRITATAAVPNTAPVAVADAYSTSQDTPLTVPAAGVLANDTDAQTNPLTAIINAGPGHGSVTLNASGGFTYTPAAAYTGADSFTYHANDGSLNSNIVAVTITVNALVAGALANGSFEIGDFVAAFPAVPFDHYQLNSWTVTGNPVGFAAVLPSVPATDGSRMVIFNGASDSFDGTISQTFATTPGATYQLEFDVGIIVAPNFTSRQQLLGMAVNGGSLLSQDVTLTCLIGGATQWTAKNYSFTASSATCTLSFTDKSGTLTAPAANDSDLLLDNVRITATAAVSNTAPVAVPDAYSTSQDTPLTVPAAGVLANDTDAQTNSLVAIINAGPGHGSVTLNANGGFTYIPAAGYTGADSFTYHANDGNLNSNIVTVSITVNALVAGALVNGSFEADFTGWTTTGNQFIATAVPYAATDGTKLAVFNGGNLPPNAVLSQSFATTMGQTYTLAFDAGVLAYNTNSQTIQVTVTGAGSLLSRTITLIGAGGGTSRWLPQSFTFVANSTAATLTFRDQSTSTNSLDLLLDNIRITATASALASLVPQQGSNGTTSSLTTSQAAITPPPASLGTPSLSGTPGNITLRMTAPAAGNYVLERSEDLKTWEYVSEMQCAAQGLVEFHDTQNSFSAQRPKKQMFYRIGLQPDVPPQ